MSAPEESLNDQDPDYVSTISDDQVQQEIYEENGKYIDSTPLNNRLINILERKNLTLNKFINKLMKCLYYSIRIVVIVSK